MTVAEIQLDLSGVRSVFGWLFSTTARFVVLVCHRRAGKTVAGLTWLGWRVLTCPLPNPRGAYIAPKLKQARRVAWAILKRMWGRLPGASISETALSITFANGGVIEVLGADNPDDLRGTYLDAAFLDEYGKSRPQVLPEVVLPMLADRSGSLIVAGTPHGPNHFDQLQRRAKADPNWLRLVLKASETGIIPEAELALIRSNMSDAAYAREFECSFDAPSPTQLITGDVLREMTTGPGVLDLNEPLILGVDVARSPNDDGDRSAIAYRRGRDARTMPIQVIRTDDPMRLASAIADEIERLSPAAVMVDEIGLGWGVIGRLRQLGYRPIAVNASARAQDDRQYANKRAEMYHRLAEWGASGGVIRDDEELVEELSAITFEPGGDARQRKLITSKLDIKAELGRSPDLADSIALTFAETVATAAVRETRASRAGQRYHVGASDYDPLA